MQDKHGRFKEEEFNKLHLAEQLIRWLWTCDRFLKDYQKKDRTNTRRILREKFEDYKKLDGEAQKRLSYLKPGKVRADEPDLVVEILTECTEEGELEPKRLIKKVESMLEILEELYKILPKEIEDKRALIEEKIRLFRSEAE